MQSISEAALSAMGHQLETRTIWRFDLMPRGAAIKGSDSVQAEWMDFLDLLHPSNVDSRADTTRDEVAKHPRSMDPATEPSRGSLRPHRESQPACRCSAANSTVRPVWPIRSPSCSAKRCKGKAPNLLLI
jgi:hypothetical protein